MGSSEMMLAVTIKGVWIAYAIYIIAAVAVPYFLLRLGLACQRLAWRIGVSVRHRLAVRGARRASVAAAARYDEEQQRKQQRKREWDEKAAKFPAEWRKLYEKMDEAPTYSLAFALLKAFCTDLAIRKPPLSLHCADLLCCKVSTWREDESTRKAAELVAPWVLEEEIPGCKEEGEAICQSIFQNPSDSAISKLRDAVTRNNAERREPEVPVYDKIPSIEKFYYNNKEIKNEYYNSSLPPFADMGGKC